ncbi:MAG: DEAD/DEAH box helicase, partial [Micrococcales bacterium]
MPNFGKSSARPNTRKPRHGKTGAPAGHGHASEPKFKEREDGRGGRSPKRQAFFEAKQDAPREDRPRFDRDDRPARDDRCGRFERNDRPGFKRDDRPGFKRDDRPGFKRDDRAGAGAGRGRFERDDRPRFGDDRRGPRTDRDFRDDRVAGDRPRFDRDARPARDDRGGDDRRRDWAPRDNQGGKPRGRFGDDRPRFGDDRPRFDRDARPARDDRGGDDRRRDWAPREDRPRFDRDASPARRFEDSGDRRPQRTDRVERDASRQRSFDDRRAANPNKKAFAEDVVLERLESADATDVVLAESFESMGLHPRLIEALAKMGAESPFPIQAATIPAAIGGKDVLGRGKTGSGKTVAFSVPVVAKLVAAGSRPR